MFRALCLFALLIASSYFEHSYAQEFHKPLNGLIFDKHTMSALRKIVDSGNIEYRKAVQRIEYYSLPQAMCHEISLDSSKAREAVNDLEKNISFDSFCKKYPYARIQRNVLVLKKLEQDNRVIRISGTGFDKGKHDDLLFSATTAINSRLKGSWLYNYTPNGEYMTENVSAFFFLSDFESIRLPIRYCRQIQYSDNLIDTSNTIFSHTRVSSMQYLSEEPVKNKTPERVRLSEYLDKHTSKPDQAKYAIDSSYVETVGFFERKDSVMYVSVAYEKEYYRWLEKKDSIIGVSVAYTADFRQRLKSAIEEAIKVEISDDELDELAIKYDTKEHALQLRRMRKIRSSCGFDWRPTIRAQEIALLAAETLNRAIFLRAYLDMFVYIRDTEKVYIKQLEQLNVDLLTLLMGVSFRINNPSGHHYFGSIETLGWVLSKAENHDLIESELTAAIQDDQLDDFNRILIYKLFNNYIYSLENSLKKESIAKLKAAVKKLPAKYKERMIIGDLGQLMTEPFLND